MAESPYYPWTEFPAAWSSGTLGAFARRHWVYLVRQSINLGAWACAIFLGWTVCSNGLDCHGEATCDFAGQWLMGKMFATGQARLLYIVPPEKEGFAQGYPDPKECEDMIKDILRKGMEHVPSKPLVEPLALLPAAGLPWGALVPPLELIDSVCKGDYHPAEPLVEGPLYPPTAGLLFMPLGYLQPKQAHALMNFFYTFSVIATAYFISFATKRRLLMGEVAAITLCFPNYLQAILLGQNSLLTLLILSAGWYAYSHKRPLLCGLIWGLLAYKPVFAVSLLLVPLALPSGRMFLGMVLGGGGFVLATLPFVGTQGLDRLVTQYEPIRKFVRNDDVRRWLGLDAPLQPIDYLNWPRTNPWERWLVVGHHAAYMYTYDRNWVWMSRDLTGLPYRTLWDRESWRNHMHYLYHRYFRGVDSWHRNDAAGHADPDYNTSEDFQARVLQAVQTEDAEGSLHRLALLLVAGVAGMTLLVAWGAGLIRWWRQQDPDSLFEQDRRAFILTGALLTVFHFMHYDVLVFVLPACLALSNLGRYGWLGRLWVGFTVIAFMLCYIDLWDPVGVVRFPLETGVALVLWAGLLIRLLIKGPWLLLTPRPLTVPVWIAD